MAAACAAACAMAAVSIAHAGGEPVTSWSLLLPEEQPVAFRGVVSMDGAGMGTGAMLYPAPSVAGFVAAVITHGILSETFKADQKSKLQTTADQVLAPYRPLLEGYSNRDLTRRGLEKMATAGTKQTHEASQTPATEWIMEIAPEIAMTQDQRALVLDNSIKLYRRGQPSKSSYKVVVRIVSHPAEGTDLLGYWGAGDGPRLKDESAALLAESLDVALLDIGGVVAQGDAPFRTVRYFEGGGERMERAQVVSERCNRLVLKTLRGGLMSVPPKTPTDCAAAAK
jgi:hypothetical protein